MSATTMILLQDRRTGHYLAARRFDGQMQMVASTDAAYHFPTTDAAALTRETYLGEAFDVVTPTEAR